MKIFSNDFVVNLPKNKKPTKGGPAKFSRLFQKEIINRGHKWVGLVIVDSGHKFKSNLVYKNGKKTYWSLLIPNGYVSQKFSKAKKYQDPSKSGRDIINEVKNILNVEQPDLVFLNGFWCLNWAILIAANELNIPVITLYAGVWSIELDLYADFYSEAGLKIFKKMEIDSATLSTCNIFLNKTTKDYFTKNIYKIPKSKIEIIPLPCEKLNDDLKNKIKKQSNEFKNIGIVARWDRIKNHKAFYDFACESKTQGKKWNFFAVTTIPETNKFKEFKDGYRKLIKVLAPMDQKKLKLFYQKMDFMLLPSFFDVSPHVVLEAALENVPTFISKNVGHMDFFKDNNLQNFIVDFSNSKKAIVQIESIKNIKYPLTFVNLLKERHNPEGIFDSYEKLFNEII